MHYITLIYTVDMLRVWPLLALTVDLIGQYHCVYSLYTLVFSGTITFILSLQYLYVCVCVCEYLCMHIFIHVWMYIYA